MLISTTNAAIGEHYKSVFQSLDWVDVDFDWADLPAASGSVRFQSLDWVDVDFDSVVYSAKTW